MKWRGTYLVWILLALLVVLIAYSWNSRETFGEKCWAPEEPMSAKTGYIDFSKGQGGMPTTFDQTDDFLKYVYEQQKKQGKCKDNQDQWECLGNIDKGSDRSPDMAKGYCSTANCSAIYVQNGVYRPVMAPRLPTSPLGRDGTPIPDSVWASIYKLIIPRECAPPPPPPPAPAPLAPPSMAPDVAGLNPQASNSLGQPPRTFTCTAN